MAKRKIWQIVVCEKIVVWAYPQSSDDMVTSSRSHSHTKLPIEHGQTYHPMGNIRSSSMQSGCTLHYTKKKKVSTLIHGQI